jgi:hypothetical protein
MGISSIPNSTSSIIWWPTNRHISWLTNNAKSDKYTCLQPEGNRKKHPHIRTSHWRTPEKSEWP